jgi:hypothetical protein
MLARVVAASLAGAKRRSKVSRRRAAYAARNMPLAHSDAEHVTRKVITRQQLPTFANLASRPAIERGKIETFGRFADYCFY